MIVPFVDLNAQYAILKKEIDAAISDVVESGRFIQGPHVEGFEAEFSDYIGARHCISVNSGTDALIQGIRALELKEGDEVIVPVHTFIATALGASENGVRPVFVDMDAKDYGMDLADLKRKITPRTRAIIVVHLFGQPDKIDEIQNIINSSGQKIHLIEDACQAHGALYKEKRVGTFGIFSAFSFYPGKNLGAYGDGGAVVTNDDELATKLKLLREYGQKKKYVHDSAGINSRLDAMQAAVLRVKLPHLDTWNRARQQWADYYTKNLPSSVVTPAILSERKSVYHLYVIQVQRRDELIKYLADNEIQALIHYPIPLHMQKAYVGLGYKKGDFPVAESFADSIVSLPMYPELTKKQADFVVQSIRGFYER